MAKFKIVSPAESGVTASGGNFDLEMEALIPIDAEIVEVEAPTDEDLVEKAKGADALYVRRRLVTKTIVDGLSDSIKCISTASVGVDKIDVAAATAHNVPVTNMPDTFIEEVADHAMMLILATHRRLVEHDRIVREGRWNEARPLLYQHPRLMGLTLGLVAFGHVARGVAKRARAFGLNVIAYDPFIEELVMVENGVEPVATLQELLERSDIVSMHAPATDSASHMLGKTQFQQFKKGSLFVNTGRGATVDEPYLIEALENGTIAAAGLDVLEQEPPGGNNPLLKMDNVILTAHVASASARFEPTRKRRVGHEMALVLSGRWPMSCVNPSVLANTGLTRWQPYSMERGPGS